MDIKSLFLGVILGAIPSWIIAHWYYKKSTSDLNKQFDNLTKEEKEIKPAIEALRQYPNIEYEQSFKNLNLILNQFDSLMTGVNSFEKLTGSEQKNERLAVLEHILNELRES